MTNGSTVLYPGNISDFIMFQMYCNADYFLGQCKGSKGTHKVWRAARGPLENREQQGDPWSIESSKGTLGV